MKHWPFRRRLAIAILLFALAAVIADEPKTGTVVDVVTARVVAVTLPDTALVPDQELLVLRDGQEIGRLRVKTATGICQVIEGEIRKGDQVRVAPARETTADAAATATDESAATPAAELPLPLRLLLQAEGNLRVALLAAPQLPETGRQPLAEAIASAEALLPRLRPAARVYLTTALAERVAATLREAGQGELAERLGATEPDAEPPLLAPVWPTELPAAMRPPAYGQLHLLEPDPALWATPGRWGEPPRDPAFAGTTFRPDETLVSPESSALVRRDFQLADAEISGEFRIASGGFLYLLVRSGVIVKFYGPEAGEHAGEVALKVGYDNLQVVDAVSDDEPVLGERWHRFRIHLRGNWLQVDLDDETKLDTDISDGIMGRTGEVPPHGHVGFGGYRANGAFRRVTVTALTPGDRQRLPQLRASRQYLAAGDPIEVLRLPEASFLSLSHHQTEDHQRTFHLVADGTLSLRGAPYLQFSARELAADHFVAAGRLRATRRGSVWFRANRYLLFGLDVSAAGRPANEDARPFLVSHTTSTFRQPDQTFAGKPLVENQWYDWELEFHDPIGIFRLNGETVMMAVTPSDRPTENRGPNQLGISVYIAQAEIADLRLQKLTPAASAIHLPADTVARLLTEGLDQAKQAIAACQGPDAAPGAATAARVLTGERAALLADDADFQALADRQREAHDWPTCLALLDAAARRYPEGSPERQAAQQRHDLERQKYQIAVDMAEVGDLGLDNLLRLGRQAGTIAPAADRRHLWIAIPAVGQLVLYSPGEHRIVRRLKTTIDADRLLARRDYLLLRHTDAKTITRLSMDDGTVLGTYTVAEGRIVDLALDPRRDRTWVTIDENRDRTLKLEKFRVHQLTEATMVATPTEAIGMQLAADPLGRYLYTGFQMSMADLMRYGDFDPGFLTVSPDMGQLDHLLAWRLNGDSLAFLADSPMPGIAGCGIIPQPDGHGVIYLARGGIFDADDEIEDGVPVFRATQLRQRVGVIPVGEGASLLSYHPTRPELYIWNGQQLRRYSSNDFAERGTIHLPDVVRRAGPTQLACSPDGSELLIAYAGSEAGVYIHRLDDLPAAGDEAGTALPDGLARLAPEALLAHADALPADQAELASRIHRFLAEEYAFTPVGERVATRLLEQSPSPFYPRAATAWQLTAEPLADLPAPPDPGAIVMPEPVAETAETPAEPAKPTPEEIIEKGDFDDFFSPRPRQPAGRNKPAKADATAQTLELLDSLRAAATTCPDSWLWTCQQAAAELTDEPHLLLAAADVHLSAKRPIQATRLAQRVLMLTNQQGERAVAAYTLLADAYDQLGDRAGRLEALRLALAQQPRNAFLHRRFGDACQAANLPNRAAHHWLLAWHLYPSQHDLHDRLIAAKVLPDTPAPAQPSVADLFRATSPSVILIKHELGVGTGFFITRDGLILTNYHVIGDERDVEVSFTPVGGAEPRTMSAQVLATDTQHDMALLRLLGAEPAIRPIIVGGRHQPVIGEEVLVIGNPGLGNQVLTQTLTEGRISGLDRKIGGQNYLQTSAAVNPGNSGGPLLSRDGTVIGMITLKGFGDNLGFAIPAEALLDFVRRQVGH